MHELSLTRRLVDIAGERADGARVLRVRLEIGRLSGVMAEAIRFCFDVCAEGTALDGAALEIVELPGSGRCPDCGQLAEMEALFDRCRCGGALDCIGGDELRLKEMEIA